MIGVRTVASLAVRYQKVILVHVLTLAYGGSCMLVVAGMGGIVPLVVGLLVGALGWHVLRERAPTYRLAPLLVPVPALAVLLSSAGGAMMDSYVDEPMVDERRARRIVGRELSGIEEMEPRDGDASAKLYSELKVRVWRCGRNCIAAMPYSDFALISEDAAPYRGQVAYLIDTWNDEVFTLYRRSGASWNI
ncbi:MAG: hypothetical protein ABEN55_00850 [Bradymonadaceae bacterium]